MQTSQLWLRAHKNVHDTEREIEIERERERKR